MLRSVYRKSSAREVTYPSTFNLTLGDVTSELYIRVKGLGFKLPILEVRISEEERRVLLPRLINVNVMSV